MAYSNLLEQVNTIMDVPVNPNIAIHSIRSIGENFSYGALKLRERFGLLDENGFDKLLALDFQEEIAANQPIYGIFSPKAELISIRELSKDKKRAAIDICKDKLERQRCALGSLRVFIERSIEFNNDVPRGKLIGLVNLFGEQYGFDHRQKELIESLVDDYYSYIL